jgi:hypothetical protein
MTVWCIAIAFGALLLTLYDALCLCCSMSGRCVLLPPVLVIPDLCLHCCNAAACVQMEGSAWVQNILMTCFCYCGPFFVMFMFLNSVAIGYRVSGKRAKMHMACLAPSSQIRISHRHQIVQRWCVCQPI